MATTLPADATKANSDAATDDPKQSILVDVAGGVDTINALKAALGQAAQLNVSDGLEIGSQPGGTPDDLKVRLQAVSGLKRTAAGLALDIAAVQKQSFTAVDDAGAADAYALTIAPAITAYAKYQAFTFVAVGTNTGASTLAVNGLAAKAIKKWQGGAKVALEAGDITAGQLSVVVYDATDFVLLTAPVGEDYIQVRDDKASGTDGGTFTSGAWRTRDLNTEKADTGAHASVAANQITLAAGTYRFRASAPARGVSLHKLRLQNVTDAATIEVGVSVRQESTDADVGLAFVSGRFTISASKVLELQHRCSNSTSTDGFGAACGFGVVEVYAEIEFWKER